MIIETPIKTDTMIADLCYNGRPSTSIHFCMSADWDATNVTLNRFTRCLSKQKKAYACECLTRSSTSSTTQPPPPPPPPPTWKNVRVILIPKPGKEDAFAYRQISPLIRLASCSSWLHSIRSQANQACSTTGVCLLFFEEWACTVPKTDYKAVCTARLVFAIVY
jgi:hypothetical protein